MAKRTSTTSDAIEGFAEDLGRMLGNARNKAEGWMNQRQAIVKNLTELRDTATKLLTDLGHETTVGRRHGPRVVDAVSSGMEKSRKAGRPHGSGRKKKRTMSADARRRISEAQKKRWALQKAGEKKK